MLPLMENTCEHMAKCRLKSKLDLRLGFWQVELTKLMKDPLDFFTPQGKIIKWEVMPFGVSSAPAVFQEPMNKILSLLRAQYTKRDTLSLEQGLQRRAQNI